VVAYLRTLDLEDYLGSYDRREVLVLADSGYDNKKIGSSPSLRPASESDSKRRRADY
jgi:hypothetical protein